MTMPTRYVRGPDGKIVAVPAPIVPPEEVEPTPEEEVEEREEPREDGFSDILDVTEEDIIGTEGVALPEEEDTSDLFDVEKATKVSPGDVIGGGDPDMSDDVLESPAEITEEDMGNLFGVKEEEAMEYPPKPKKPKIRRTTKQYPIPPTTLGGMRGDI